MEISPSRLISAGFVRGAVGTACRTSVRAEHVSAHIFFTRSVTVGPPRYPWVATRTSPMFRARRAADACLDHLDPSHRLVLSAWRS